MPQEFINFQMFATLAGATGIVVVVANTIRVLTRWYSPWPPFLCAQMVAFVGSYVLDKLVPFSVGETFLAFLNGCLLFLTALGSQDMIVVAGQPSRLARPQGGDSVKWTSRWL